MDNKSASTNHAARRRRKIHPLNIIRPVIQLVSFLLVPGLFITFFSALGNIVSALAAGTFVISEQAGNLILTVAVLLITFLWGRFFCGFMCSFGTMQDALRFVGKHIPFHPVISPKADRILKYLKYAVLLFVVVGVWCFGIFGSTVWSPWTVFGMYASPFKGFPAEPVFLSVGGLLLLIIMIGSLFVQRFFCKYLCPMGALFTLISRFRLFKLRRNSSQCSGQCRACTRKCAMSIPLYQMEQVRSGECINCLRCTAVCPDGNLKVQTVPAVSGTLTTAALAGVCFSGTLSGLNAVPVSSLPESAVSRNAENSSDRFRDGTYSGSAAGYRGSVSVTVTVSGGSITDITVNSYSDDNEFFLRAKQQIIPAIIASQNVNVSAVSGATFSSQGIIHAVQNALADQLLTTGESSDLSDASSSAPEQTSHTRGRKHRTESTQPESSSPAETPQVPFSSTEESSEASSESERSSEVLEEPSTEPAEEASAEPIGEPAPESAAQSPEEHSADNITEQSSEPETSVNGSFRDGVYTGSGTGFRGTTSVSVTVKNGMISEINVISYQDDDRYFTRAQSGVIALMLSSQSIDVSAVSGATFSSNSLKEAVANALGLEFINPNSTMSGRGRH